VADQRPDALHHGVVEVVAPATSANLGPGFDALGLALSLADRLRVQVRDDGLVVDVDGIGADEVPRDETHLVVRAMRAAFARMDVHPPGIALSCHNVVPHGRGLGSSAAAIVGGIVAARGLVVDGQQRLPDRLALEVATELEGHPDNVAACLLGGLTVAWTDEQRLAGRAVRLDADLDVVALVPAAPVSTSVARGMLPGTVAHVDAAANAGRAALLVAALSRPELCTPEVLLAGTRDWLHQQARTAAMPASLALVAALRSEGHAAIVSGAGPTVLVLVPAGADVDAVEQQTPHGWSCHRLAVDQRGARVVAPGAHERAADEE
jgi:homoserine kinase